MTETAKPRVAARITLEIYPPDPPCPNAVVSYYVEAGERGGEEREHLYQALADYVQIGTRMAELVALAVTVNVFGEIERLWKTIYNDTRKEWRAWK